MRASASASSSTSAAAALASMLAAAARAHDRDVHAGLGEHPRDRELAEGDAEVARQRVQPAHDAEVAPQALPGEGARLAPPVVGGEGRALVDAPGQQPARQGAVGEHADVVRARVGEDLLLDLALEQVVRGLQHLHRPHGLERLHLGHVVVRDPDVADLALLDHLLERPRRLLLRDVRVGPVDLVDVDRVDAEVAQALLDAPAQEGRGGVALRRPDAALGGDDHAVAVAAQLRPQRRAQQLLRRPEPVGLGRVEERDAEVARPPDGGDGRLLVEAPPLPAELPGAERDPGHLEPRPAERDRLHRRVSSLPSPSGQRLTRRPRIAGSPRRPRAGRRSPRR